MMTTAEGGLAYQRWLATINQVCGHFSTAFKQRFGVTPGEYRKRCR